MGVIDSTQYRVACPACKAEETLRAVERGSTHGGGSWSGPDSYKFHLQLVLTHYGESVIVSAICKCGSEATVELTGPG